MLKGHNPTPGHHKKRWVQGDGLTKMELLQFGFSYEVLYTLTLLENVLVAEWLL